MIIYQLVPRTFPTVSLLHSPSFSADGGLSIFLLFLEAARGGDALPNWKGEISTD